MSSKNAFEMLQSPVLMGTIGAAQGLRGDVRVNSHTEDPMAIGDYGNLVGEDGRLFEILDIRQHKTVVIVRFRGINDRTAAESLNGLNLYVDRSSLNDDDLDEDEYFYADLEGLAAIDKDGTSWGIISGIFDFGAGDIIELSMKGRRPVLIPFTETSVLEIDLDAGRILIDPQAAGLIDDGEGPPDGGGDR